MRRGFKLCECLLVVYCLSCGELRRSIVTCWRTIRPTCSFAELTVLVGHTHIAVSVTCMTVNVTCVTVNCHTHIAVSVTCMTVNVTCVTVNCHTHIAVSVTCCWPRPISEPRVTVQPDKHGIEVACSSFLQTFWKIYRQTYTIIFHENCDLNAIQYINLF